MIVVGIIFLGGFIGVIIGLGLRTLKPDAWTNIGKMLTTILSAALGGSVLNFIDLADGNNLGSALFLYSIGLVVGLALAYAKTAVERVKSKHLSEKLLGWVHVVAVVALVVFVIAAFVSQTFRDLLPKLENIK